ncbi:MAG TPA: phosphatase domain-containing protein [Eudoraea sp.]|nr:phosphatase domain-containing protein [Eudoraea sp.]
MGFFGNRDRLQIIAFQSYGTTDHLYARGRALEDEDIDLSEKGLFKLLLNTWKRFETDEVRNAPIQIKLPDGRIIDATTDQGGFFLVDQKMESLGGYVNEEGWLAYEISYTDLGNARQIKNENCFRGEILIPSKEAAFGVISDIDDTIMHTGVVSSLKWRVIANTFFKSAEKRVPLEGAARFYHKLHRGRSGNNANPIFYVSHSPWNLYRYLEFFLTKNNFPKGPILLRNFPGLRSRKTPADQPQKQKEIANILKTYPSLNFILIGDSGEGDADIYMNISRAYPERILAIYLRSVNHKKKMLRVRGLFENYKSTPVLLVEKSRDALEHARFNGFIK